MAFKRSAFVIYEKVTPFSIEMGDKSAASAVGRGDVRLTLDRDGTPVQCKLLDVIHVPPFVYNLVSVSALGKHGFEVRFQPDTVRIVRDDTIVASGTRVGGLTLLTSTHSHSKGLSSGCESTFVA